MKNPVERILIFGAGGTLGQEMMRHILRVSPSAKVIAWDRQKIPLCSPGSREASFDERVRPEMAALSPHIVFNFAVAEGDLDSHQVNTDFPIWLSRVSKEMNYKLIHTSTVMVFSDRIQGPYTLESKPDASEGYGLQKRLAEEGVLANLGESIGSAIVARIGWQIGQSETQNTMRRFLELEARRNNGLIGASGLWFPSCSRLSDTAEMLWNLRNDRGGLYQIEGNDGMSFAEIARRLRAEYDANHWKVEETEEFRYNQLMLDDRISMPPLFPG